MTNQMQAEIARHSDRAVDASKADTVVGWAEDRAGSYPFPRALYSFHASWEPGVTAAVQAKRLTPCTPAIGGEMALIGYWIPEALAERLDHEIYVHLKDHAYHQYRIEKGWGRSLESAIDCLGWLADLALVYG